MKTLYLIFCLVILVHSAGCIFVPKFEAKDENPCHLVTRQFTVDVVSANLGSCSDPRCIPIALGVSTATLIVSGSIMAAGNTIHWIEAQGRCDDTATKKAIERLKASTKRLGGFVINTKDDVINWLNMLCHAKQE